MKADRALWIDERGKLVSRPPASGFKIASAKGQDINPRLVKQFRLSQDKKGRVVQGEEGSPGDHLPEELPGYDEDLRIEEAPEEASGEAPEEEKMDDKTEDKMADKPKNKGRGLSITTRREGTRSSRPKGK